MNATETAGILALNEALRAELALIDVYSSGEASQLLHGEVRDLLATYREHHVQHAALLTDSVRKLGGTPTCVAAGAFASDPLDDEEDLLKLAARMEQGAVRALLDALARLPCPCEASIATAAMLGEEATHCAVLRQALGERPVFMA